METAKVISALNSKMRREILKTISEEPMTVMQVLEELKRRKFEVKYRETVYRALEKLLDAGLVEKYYDPEKGLCYRIMVKLVTLNLANGTIEIR